MASGLGAFASSTDATGLTIQGSRLKYVGAATSTNRLFTVGTAGATLDASGTGALTFSNTAALGVDVAENRVGIVSQSGAPGNEDNEVFGVPKFLSAGQPVPFNTEDLVVGMRIQDVHATPQLEDDLEITGVMTNHAVEVGEREVEEGETAWAGITQTQVRTFKFGPAPARFLTLSGSNTGNNTLAPLVAERLGHRNAVGDEVTDGYGTVGIQQDGPRQVDPHGQQHLHRRHQRRRRHAADQWQPDRQRPHDGLQRRHASAAPARSAAGSRCSKARS